MLITTALTLIKHPGETQPNGNPKMAGEYFSNESERLKFHFAENRNAANFLL